jgi:hypothetical protein
MDKATEPLSTYAKALGDEILVLTVNDEPVVAMVSLRDLDRESLALSLSPKFMEIIEKSRRELRSGRRLSLEEMKREISARQFIYVVVIYLSFFLYIGTSYIMIHSLLPTLLKNVQGLGIEFYKNYLFQGILIYSIFSGASLGILTERSVIAGIKHILLMLIVGYLMFKLYIGG